MYLFRILQKENILRISNSLKRFSHNRNFCTKQINLDVNTNVPKDVILYKYENRRYFFIANLFAYGQFCFWTFLGKQTYDLLRFVPVSKDENVWWRKWNLGENFYRNTITSLLLFLGTAMLLGTWFYTIRSVSYIVLRKGGREATFITLTPLMRKRMVTANLRDISCMENRLGNRPFLPIKVKGTSFHFMVDARGEFKNPKLFDTTVGVFRKLK